MQRWNQSLKVSVFLICTYSSCLKSIFPILFSLLLSYTILIETPTLFLVQRLSWLSQGDIMVKCMSSEATRTCIQALTSALNQQCSLWQITHPRGPSISSSVKWGGYCSANFTVLWWCFNESLAENRCIVWGKNPSAAQHLPYVPKEKLCSIQHELARSQIALCAKTQSTSRTPLFLPH